MVLPVASEVLSYPCGNTTDAAMFLAGESPWPWPAHTGPIGQPIHLQVREGQELVITTATITHTAGPGIDVGTAANGAVAGATSMLQKLDWNNDTNNRFTGRKNVASLMPEKTMYPGSTYRVQITGTNGGTTFSKDFSFITTGGADYSACLATIPGRINATSYWDAARKANALSNVPYFCAGHIYGY